MKINFIKYSCGKYLINNKSCHRSFVPTKICFNNEKIFRCNLHHKNFLIYMWTMRNVNHLACWAHFSAWPHFWPLTLGTSLSWRPHRDLPARHQKTKPQQNHQLGCGQASQMSHWEQGESEGQRLCAWIQPSEPPAAASALGGGKKKENNSETSLLLPLVTIKFNPLNFKFRLQIFNFKFSTLKNLKFSILNFQLRLHSTSTFPPLKGEI